MLDEKARKIQEIANQLGWNEDVEKLVERIRQIDNGLIQEDEFHYLLYWFGRCKIIHKLDQLVPPEMVKKTYTIPDLFAVFDCDGELKSYYIEVKTSQAESLSWTEQYYQGLINYSKLTNTPVLVAWKWKSFSAWTLFELKHFEKKVTNYKIGYLKALEESLMSNLAGDFMIVPYDEIGLHLKLKKQQKIKKEENETLWQTTIESIYFTGKDGKEIKSVDSGILAYLFATPSEESVSETETHIINSFVPHPNKSTFAQLVPINLTRAWEEKEVNWSHMVKLGKHSISYSNLLESLTKAIDKELIRNILFITPKSG